MKKFIFSMIALFAIALTTTYANNPSIDPENIIVEVEKVDAKTIKLFMANLQKETTAVTIEDQEGKSYFSQYVNNHNGYHQNLNLKKLPKGRYILKISKKGQDILYVLVVKQDDIMLSDPVKK